VWLQVAGAKFAEKDRDALTQRIMFGGDEVVKAKAGGGSATLSMAYAGAKFAFQVLRARSGVKGLVECSYVQSNVGGADLSFFSSPVELGVDGVEKIHGTCARPVLSALCSVSRLPSDSLFCSAACGLGYGTLSPYEQQLLKAAQPELKSSIDKGVEFGQKFKL
jgi:malate dehydrogenase